VTSHVQAIVVGGGISGLVCAYALRKAGVDVQLLEASPRVGGIICSARREGFLLEIGPQSFRGTVPLHNLCMELGIATKIVQAPSAAPRYVLIKGELRSVPLSPPALLKSSLIGTRTKLSLGRDALGSSKPPEQDESVAAFVRRKFTAELLDRLAGPFISGIHAGDPERLSLRSAFPQLFEAERSTGSVIRGLKRAMEASEGPRERPTLLNFREGMETLTRALREKLGAAVRVESELVGIGRGSPSGPFQLKIRESGQESLFTTDTLLVSAPADVAARLLSELNANLERLLGGIEYASMAVVSLGYRRLKVSHALNGFGFLVPRSAKLRTLGTVWNSSLFPDRAPEGQVLLTSFVGGATDADAIKLSVEDLVTLVHKETAPLLGIRETPVFSNVVVYPRALPQYNLGHSQRLADLEKVRQTTPGLWLLGNYLRGPSMGACVEQSQSVAQDVLSQPMR
jgi:oxygen-dependent protoporphyrinogen oxidase